MSTSTRNSPTIKRLHREARELSSTPAPDFCAAPLDDNLFEWHFTLRGPPGSPYEQGIYHGRIVLPQTYPLRPPSFRFLTPSGRFEVNREICLSISGHHEETWQPAWGIRTALTAIRAFMAGDAKGQVGGVDATKEARESMARESSRWRCATCGGKSCEAMLREGTEGAQETQAKEEVPEGLRLGVDKKEGDEKGPAAEGAAGVLAPAGALVEQQRPAPPTRQNTERQARRRQERRQQGVWVDGAIAFIMFLLVVMLLRYYARRYL